jgi:outer membrane protein OmpA-like peptidoglycan-associated protein
MKFRNALVAATMMALPLAAQAQPITGLYVGGGAGVNIMASENFKLNLGGGAVTTSGDKQGLSSNVGPAVNLSLGYGLGNGLRAELEGVYTYNSFKSNSNLGSAGGHEQKYGPMVNLLYDFVGLTPVVQPYVGVGVGYLWAQENNLHAGTTVGGGTVLTTKNGAEGSFAYQGIAGVAFPIASAPGLSLTLDYRFLGLAENRDYSGTGVTRVGTGTRAFSTQVRATNDYNNMIMVGFTYNFGAAPPPAPAPVAAPVPPSPVSRSYLVFFDWDKATLTDRARQIVSEAAANSTKVQYTRLEVNGYTDTSGTPQYNQGLSVRRAQAVAAELVKDGVPKSAITIQGFGETHLLVPTGPGVREPQNRRVEIIIK